MKYYPTSWGYHFSHEAHCCLFAIIENDFDLKSGQIIPTKWNFVTEIQFISEMVKLFQLSGIL